MDTKIIESLVKIMDQNGLTELSVSEGGLSISLKREGSGISVDPKPPLNTDKSEKKQIKNKAGFSFDNLEEISSPIAGVFYAAPSPDAEPFVKVGDKVKKGDVLCIIEAMKLMNELTAERDGEIADICVENEQIVEFGQTLFMIY